MIIVSINIASSKGGAMQEVDAVEAVADRGLKGDRYFAEEGTFSKSKRSNRQVTLIEIEAIEAIDRDYGIEFRPGDARRNIVTRGVALNHLVGKDFKVGEALFHGTKLCEPCGYLERLTIKGVRESLIHRGGLCARILNSGLIKPGDAIQIIQPEKR